MFTFKSFINRNYKFNYLNCHRLISQTYGGKLFNLRHEKVPGDYALQHYDSFNTNDNTNTCLSSRETLQWSIQLDQKVKKIKVELSKIEDSLGSKIMLNPQSAFLFPYGSSNQLYPLIEPKVPEFIPKSCASKKGRRRSKGQDKDDKSDDEEDDDDDDADDDDEIVPVDYLDLDIETGSLRLDTVMKTALPIPRKKIEEVHAEDKIRVNGERVQKRSMDVAEGDIIDYILGRSRQNPKLLEVKRVKLLSVPEYKTAKDRVKFKIRRWPNLTIENYSLHPFESMLVREDAEEK